MHLVDVGRKTVDSKGRDKGEVETVSDSESVSHPGVIITDEEIPPMFAECAHT